ncbi:hypothetical protein [Ruegeria arenilitoris]|uniref:hypothetical protein n=1 Tax=Ruegeria arenilitoris TaxID=1173585 RepID=UPI00147E8F0F|nr:hypothetical protein [Ruegeria arenilitoris]
MSCLDLWRGRRQKPVVAGRGKLNTKDMSFGQQLIHHERMRQMKEAEQINNRESLMPHLRDVMRGADPKPQRAEKPRETTFQPLKLEDPSSPPVEARSAEDEAEAVREGSEASVSEASDGLAKWNARRPNVALADSKKAEAETLDRKSKAKRNKYTKKRKLTPGKDQS